MQSEPTGSEQHSILKEYFAEDGRKLRAVMRRLLVCNPFYLMSAMTLLAGLHMLWKDTQGLSEIDRLQMNFLTLQGYEWLILGTVIMLARRKIWYDATLLVMVENLLVFVPFVLLSQATWLEGTGSRATLLMALAGGLSIVGRFTAIRKWFQRLRLPGRLYLAGAALLVLHILLPIGFRQLLLSTEAGPDRDGVLRMAVLVTVGVGLPLVVSLLLLLPRPKVSGAAACDQWWLAWLVGGIWLGVTGYHAWALAFVYDVRIESFSWWLPAAWAMLWVFYARRTWFLGYLSRSDQAVLVALPMVVFLGAFDAAIAPVLMGCSLVNAIMYGWLAQRHRQQRYLLTMMAVSLAGVVAYMPLDLGAMVLVSFSRTHAVVGALVMLMLILAPATRSVMLGLVAGCCATGLSWLLLDRTGVPTEWAWQVGACFILMHSLRWHRRRPWLANLARALVACGWMLASLKWLHFSEGWSPLCGTILPALLVFGAYAAYRLILGEREPRLVLHAALGILLLQPIYPVMNIVVSAGPALITLAAAFVLFAMGTALAWNRQTWLAPEEAAEAPKPAEALP